MYECMNERNIEIEKNNRSRMNAIINKILIQQTFFTYKKNETRSRLRCRDKQIQLHIFHFLSIHL